MKESKDHLKSYHNQIPAINVVLMILLMHFFINTQSLTSHKNRNMSCICFILESCTKRYSIFFFLAYSVSQFLHTSVSPYHCCSIH